MFKNYSFLTVNTRSRLQRDKISDPA